MHKKTEAPETLEQKNLFAIFLENSLTWNSDAELLTNGITLSARPAMKVPNFIQKNQLFGVLKYGAT